MKQSDKTTMQRLIARKDFSIRFSEVDSMNVVWHGSYPLYFEDAREEFGRKYGLGYMTFLNNGYYAPLVELNFKYKKAIFYQSQPEIIITYIPTESAKIVFEYEIRDKVSGETFATGRSVQVFTGFDHQLVWESPEFYRNWQKKWEVL